VSYLLPAISIFHLDHHYSIFFKAVIVANDVGMIKHCQHMYLQLVIDRTAHKTFSCKVSQQAAGKSLYKQLLFNNKVTCHYASLQNLYYQYNKVVMYTVSMDRVYSIRMPSDIRCMPSYAIIIIIYHYMWWQTTWMVCSLFKCDITEFNRINLINKCAKFQLANLWFLDWVGLRDTAYRVLNNEVFDHVINLCTNLLCFMYIFITSRHQQRLWWSVTSFCASCRSLTFNSWRLISFNITNESSSFFLYKTAVPYAPSQSNKWIIYSKRLNIMLSCLNCHSCYTVHCHSYS